MEIDRLLSMWWLPESPEVKVPGEVTRLADGAVTIELFGSLSGSLMPMDDPDPPVMHGLGSRGPFLTVRHVIRTGATTAFPGFPTEVLRPQSMIVGANVDETTPYNHAIVRTSFLREWLQLSGIRISYTSPAPEAKGSLGIAYEWPPVLTAEVAPGVTVSTWSGHQGKTLTSGYALNEDVALKVSLATPVLVDEIVSNYVMPLVDLVSFGTGRSNAVDLLTLRSPSVVDKVGNEEQPRDLEFLTEWAMQQPKQDPPSPDEMNFSRADASMGFEPLLQDWFRIQSTLRPCLAPYFGLLYAPPIYVNQRLVSISQALEAYQRSLGSHQAMPKDEYDAFKKRLLAACPKNRVAFLTQKLGYLNQLSQVERTTRLIERARGVLGALFASRPSFATDFIHARDAQTHPGGNGDHLSGAELYDLTQTGTYLFEACIMLDLGFNEAQCAALFERQQEYLHLVKNPPKSA
jgi:hypothetical protein